MWKSDSKCYFQLRLCYYFKWIFSDSCLKWSHPQEGLYDSHFFPSGFRSLWLHERQQCISIFLEFGFRWGCINCCSWLVEFILGRLLNYFVCPEQMLSAGGKLHEQGLVEIWKTALCPWDGTWGPQSNGKFIFVPQARLFSGNEVCILDISVIGGQGSTTCTAERFLLF